MTEFSQHQGKIKVSVLLAARNEANNILRCLESLDQVDFPKDQIEILIGDDDSEDATAQLTKAFISDKKHFRYIKIENQLAGLRGKTNVLAQLAHEAQGEYFLYCDADIAVKPTWVNQMLRHFKPGSGSKAVGTVVGTTRMKHSHFLADLLSLEWLFALAVTRFFSLLGVPITGMGNNMAVTREAYFRIGGYEEVGFSIVEDYALFMKIVRSGYKFGMAFNIEVLSVSEPVNTFNELLRQRKRWMQGVMESFWLTRFSLFFSTLLVPVLLIGSIWFPQDAFNSLWQYYLLVTVISLSAICILKQWDLWKAALLFWFYMIGIGLIMLINYYLPGKTVWKGREY